MALEGIEMLDVGLDMESPVSFMWQQYSALQYATLSIWNVEAQVQVSLGTKVIVSNSKAHAEEDGLRDKSKYWENPRRN